jgi:hypothetical protein
MANLSRESGRSRRRPISAIGATERGGRRGLGYFRRASLQGSELIAVLRSPGRTLAQLQPNAAGGDQRSQVTVGGRPTDTDTFDYFNRRERPRGLRRAFPARALSSPGGQRGGLVGAAVVAPSIGRCAAGARAWPARSRNTWHRAKGQLPGASASPVQSPGRPPRRVAAPAQPRQERATHASCHETLDGEEVVDLKRHSRLKTSLSTSGMEPPSGGTLGALDLLLLRQILEPDLQRAR